MTTLDQAAAASEAGGHPDPGTHVLMKPSAIEAMVRRIKNPMDDGQGQERGFRGLSSDAVAGLIG